MTLPRQPLVLGTAGAEVLDETRGIPEPDEARDAARLTLQSVSVDYLSNPPYHAQQDAGLMLIVSAGSRGTASAAEALSMRFHVWTGALWLHTDTRAGSDRRPSVHCLAPRPTTRD